jgi:hypothetical protein
MKTRTEEDVEKEEITTEIILRVSFTLFYSGRNYK